MKAIIRRLWRDLELPLIVDASALDWLVPHTLAKNLTRVVTPHPGEAARMLNTTAEKVQANRAESLREISRRFGNCWVVLKGHQTLIGRGEGRNFCEFVRQSASGARRQRRCAWRVSCGLAGATGVANDVGKTIRSPSGSMARRRMCCKPRGQIGSWRIWLRHWGNARKKF